ncbi:hypothetical protein [Altererythrobacter sp. B11]|uniref:hypothetical protein n=1 Tax=Altererythrobacter sp. B11 TaxID=2060312 RepID=UPI0011AE84D3|nr:hypothetical protein [Altererythrobacter sp. B11]
MHVVFFGDSHAHSLIRALAKGSGEEDLIAVDVRRIKDGRANAKEIPGDLARAFPAEAVFCCLGGTEYNLLGLIESPQPFDFLLSPGDAVAPERTPVPHGLVRAALASRMRSSLARMADVRAQYECPFTCVAPPPPFAELDATVNLPRAFVPHLDKGIAPARLRLKLYNVQLELLQAHCRAEEITFMPAPSNATDDAGYLRREFWDKDPTHGNARYGQSVIEQIRSSQFA